MSKIDEKAFTAFTAFMLAYHKFGSTGLGIRKCLKEYEAAKTPSHVSGEYRSNCTVESYSWQSIDTAPINDAEMFVVRAFNVCNGFTGGITYTSDPWCVWREANGGFARWPHHFPPTHWIPLPSPPLTKKE